MFSPEEQRIIDERWKQYDAEWKQPQPMSRDQTALEIEKFRYETEARYREDQLRQSWKKSDTQKDSDSNVTESDLNFYRDLGIRAQREENRRAKYDRRSKSGSSKESDPFGWFLTGCFCTMILLYILN